MNHIRLGILVLCALMTWIVTPTWSDQATSQETISGAQTQNGQPTGEHPVQPASEPSAAASSAAAEGVQIRDAVVCQNIVNHMPVGSGDVFAKDLPVVYCYCRVVGGGGEGESFITHNWYYKGVLKASVNLPVRSPNWRTYSSKTMSPDRAGEWMVEILSGSGTPLESIIFFVQ